MRKKKIEETPKDFGGPWTFKQNEGMSEWFVQEIGDWVFQGKILLSGDRDIATICAPKHIIDAILKAPDLITENEKLKKENEDLRKMIASGAKMPC